MPEQIEKLRSSLLGIVGASSSLAVSFGKPKVMAEELERVRATFNRQGNAPPTKDRILKAITAFLGMNSIENAEQARLIAWGLDVPHVRDKSLLEMDQPFSQFIKEVWESWEKDPVSAKTWRGLLSSYFRYPGRYAEDEMGRANWDALRKLLQQTFPPLLNGRQHKPSWMLLLKEHRNILDLDPCDVYAEDALKGDTRAVDELKDVLAIPESSWFIAEWVRAQIEYACSLEERQFKQHLPRLCEVLRRNAVYINDGLTRLLTRYCDCGDTSEYAELARLAVDHWGNPKLRGSTLWGLVSPEVKGMVLKWLISKDLRIFFDLFASDHDADQDQRRLAFWMRYLDQIQDAYFALGGQAFDSKQEDYLEVKRRNEGRVSKLERGGSPNNNAFIMLVNRHAIVEFGTKGNACFCFDLDNLPFRLGDAFLVGDKSQLKKQDHPGCKDRLLHKDGLHGFERWEDEFEERLRRLGIGPDSPAVHDHARRSRSSTGRRNQSSRRDSYRANNDSMAFEMEKLIEIANFYGLQVRDMRSRGGNLWVEPHIQVGRVHRQLTQWGFTLKRDKGWWLK